MEKRKVGRPTKFNKKTRERIYELLKTPISLIAVCRGVHIDTVTLRSWRKFGEEYDEQIDNGDITEDSLDTKQTELLIFSRKCNELEMQLEIDLLEDVKKEKGGNRWIAGKRLGAAYRDRKEVEHSGKVEHEVSWKQLVEGDIEKDIE